MKVKFFNADDYSYSDRVFKMLFYQISHSEMIIRSPKCDGVNESNIDIYLGDVIYQELPCRMDGLSFRKPTPEDIAYLHIKTNLSVSADNVIVLISSNKEYFVIASVIDIAENRMDIMELPLHIFLHESNCDWV